VSFSDFDNKCFDCGLQGSEWTNPSTLNIGGSMLLQNVGGVKVQKTTIFMSKKFSLVFKF
jgi:hypothetical protein